VGAGSPEEFVGELTAPRKVFVYVPAGLIVDQIPDQLAQVLEKGDGLVDGGNSYR
jgi:6-phosphogluconate dehydrogenase